MRCLDDIDWSGWRPVDRATLVFVVDGERLLLIRKKRGLGAGKVNAPGGRIETGETPAQCGVREVEEEVGVTPGSLSHRGVLHFQFVDGYSIHVWVYRADTFSGEPIETEEATPMWTAIEAIPYSEMWEDDRIWLPVLLDGRRFSGRFLFDGERMLDHRLEIP